MRWGDTEDAQGTYGEPGQPRPPLGKHQLAQNEAAKAGGLSGIYVGAEKLLTVVIRAAGMSPKLKTPPPPSESSRLCSQNAP